MAPLDQQTDPVVLIHGAWAGSWVWDRLIPYLQAAKFTCLAIDLPGNGADALAPASVSFEIYLDHIRGVVGQSTGPVSLIAHSGGGNVASAFAERWPNLVSRIVYVAGMMLPDGLSFVDIVDQLVGTHPDAVGVNPSIVYAADRKVSLVPPEAAVAHFFNDCAEGDAWAAARRLTPQGEGGRAVVMHTTAEGFGSIPRLYVEALNDKSVILPVQRLMQRLSPGAHVHSLPTGHAPQLSAPDQLAEAIIPFLAVGRHNETATKSRT